MRQLYNSLANYTAVMVANCNDVPILFIYFANYTVVLASEIMVSYANTKHIDLRPHIDNV
jgi:hypothetical protein